MYIVTIPALSFGPAYDTLRMSEESARTFEQLLDAGNSICLKTATGTVQRLSPFNLGYAMFDEEENLADIIYTPVDVVEVRAWVFEPAPLKIDLPIDRHFPVRDWAPALATEAEELDFEPLTIEQQKSLERARNEDWEARWWDTLLDKQGLLDNDLT